MCSTCGTTYPINSPIPAFILHCFHRYPLVMTTQLAVPLEAAFYQAVGKKTKKARKNQFTREEIDVLEKYKKEYRKMTTTEDRHALIRTHILVNIFNYWFSKGVVPKEVSEKDMAQRIKVR